jgi:hypothetical protein
MALVTGDTPFGLAHLGLTLADSMESLWAMLGSKLGQEHAAACTRICDHMMGDMLMVSIGCLKQPHLMLGEITEVITTNGGKPGWVRTLQFGSQLVNLFSRVDRGTL